ncbi:MAG: WG repeat-containing protein [Clostridia bacterium]|nr:WG repeat-containing protein [Clostridia bacterium]
MNSFRRIFAVLLCALSVCGLCACGNKEEEAKTETDSEQKIEYTETWVVEPSVEADNIFALPQTKFNDKTNHYDVTFGDCYVIQKDGKFGFINSNGEIVIEPKYDTVETCICTDGYIATIKPEGSYRTTYVIDNSLSETWSYPHKCEEFSGYTYLWNSALEKVSIQNGDTQADGGSFLPEAVQLDSGKYGLVNGDKLVGASDYNAAGVFTGGLVAMSKGGKWGYINSKGEEVVPFEYEAVNGYSALGNSTTPYECSEGYVTVLEGGKYGIYKADGTQVVPCQYNALTTVHDGRAFASNDGGVWGILLVDEQISNGIAVKTTTQPTSQTEE